MTDKELKKLSKLELLELLLTETRENEKLKAELAKAKKENSIEKSAKLLNETAKQLDEALKKVSSFDNSSANVSAAAKPVSKVSRLLAAKNKMKSISELLNKAGRKKK